MFKTLTNGILIENPVFRLILGTCPTLALTTMASNALGMGLAATFVLIGSNLVISLLRKVIPDKVRIPAYITVIAGFVTVVQMLVKAYTPELDAQMGIYLPLITVNCIILARAEMFANKNTVLASVLDGIGMGIGFTAALLVMGSIRELIGNGTIFGMAVTQGHIEPMLIMILPPGGFFVYGVLIALVNKITGKSVESTGCAACGAREFCGQSQKDACANEAKELEGVNIK
jgi:electron transport complex protein RnfE